MSNYVNLKPGSVTKSTYVTKNIVISDYTPPELDVNISEKYTADIPQMVLGEERIEMNTDNGWLATRYVVTSNTKTQQVINTLKIAGKIVRSEFSKIFGNGKGIIEYKGLPSNINDQIKEYENQYSAAKKKFEEAMVTPTSEQTLIERKTFRITPGGIEEIVK